jgi:hypothetical protein
MLRRQSLPEAQQIANYIRTNSVNAGQIAVLGSEPEIFFYANPLMEAHPNAKKLQEDFIHDLETKKPKFVVMGNVATSWLRGSQTYHQAGVADIFPIN